MNPVAERLLALERAELLTVLASAIGDLTVQARAYRDRPDELAAMRAFNEAVHRLSGHLRDLVAVDEVFTASRAAGVVEAFEWLAPAALDQILRPTPTP